MPRRLPSDEQVLAKFKRCLSEADDFWAQIHSDFRKYKTFAVAVDGQWSAEERDQMGEPVTQTNRVLAYTNLVVNNAIQQDIGCFIEPVSEGASADLALVRQAQAMTLWRKGGGLEAAGYALREQVWGGFGVVKRVVDYANSRGQQKTLKWEALPDPTMFRCDPAARAPALSDMQYAIEEHQLSKAAFRKRFGALQKTDSRADRVFDGEHDRQRVFEYWAVYNDSYEETLATNGKSYSKGEYAELDEEQRPDFETDAKGKPIMRQVDEPYVEQVLIGNDRIIKRIPWLGRRIPYKVAEGRMVVLNGRKSYQAMTTHAMNPQRKYNFIQSQEMVMFSKGPQEIVFVPAEATTAGLKEKLEEASRNGSSNLVVIPYQSIDSEGRTIPPPTFKAQLMGDPVLMQQAASAIQDIEACFGMSPNSWIAPNPQASGIAMQTRQAQGETSNFDFPRNWLTMLEEGFRDDIEILPKLGISMQVKLAAGAGKERTVWVNNAVQAARMGMENFDLDEDEEYHLVIKVAPAEKSVRELAFDQFMMLAQRYPNLAVAIPDLVVRAGTNNPYTEAMAERAFRLVPKQLLQDGPDPQTAALIGQLQQAQQIIGGLQEQLQRSMDALRTVQEQLKLEKTKAASTEVLQMLDVQLKTIDVRLAELKVQQEELKTQSEAIKAAQVASTPPPPTVVASPAAALAGAVTAGTASR